MPGLLPNTDVLREGQFNERDFEVLRLIGEEDLLGFTFEGLRRKLGAHSETLSRTLHRLEEQMVLEKTGQGYKVTQKGRQMMGMRQIAATSPRVTLLRTLLPPGQNLQQAISTLNGRWFGPLRWLGYSQDDRGRTLKWVTEDGAVQIDAIFSEGELLIEGSIREGHDLADAIKASYQLVGHLSRVYPNPLAGRVAFYSLTGPLPMHN